MRKEEGPKISNPNQMISSILNPSGLRKSSTFVSNNMKGVNKIQLNLKNGFRALDLNKNTEEAKNSQIPNTTNS